MKNRVAAICVTAVRERIGWMDREKDLHELIKRLTDAAGANVTAIVLYGSAADHEFQKKHSDLNILCLLQRVNGAELASIQPVGNWWWRKGHPAPVVFTLDELIQAADVFAIELLDMKAHHRMLFGDDFFSRIDVPLHLHRFQVERELRTNVIRLRQGYLRLRGRRSELAELMIASASSFVTLFRHSLIALGELTPPDSSRAAVLQLAALLEFDAAGFLAVLDIREDKRAAADMDDQRTFSAYLQAVSLVSEEMDRRLAVPNVPK